jgi:hypothetical protein
MTTKQNEIWPLFGLLVAGGAFIFVDTTDALSVAFYVQFLTLIFHQIEEYLVPGGFVKFYNHNIFSRNPITRFKLTPVGVYVVNVIWGWGLYAGAVLFSSTPTLGLGLAIVNILNAMLHVAMGVSQRKYNPGIITSLSLMPIASCWIFWLSFDRLSFGEWVVSLAFIPGAAILVQLSIAFGCKLNDFIDRARAC